MKRIRSIYVASSWRNVLQPGLVEMLRIFGHEVYDFRNPCPGDTGFAWEEVDPAWRSWTVDGYRKALEHPIAKAAHGKDMAALDRADTCILVLPSGRSASWEFGYAMARGKDAYVVDLAEKVEPELMYRGATILGSMKEFFDAFERSAG